MKKCVIMFGLLILALVLAVITDQNDEVVADELATSGKEGKDMVVFGQSKKEKLKADPR